MYQWKHSRGQNLISAKEKQAAAKQTFVFLALLTSKRPAIAGQKARKRGLASEYDIISAEEKQASCECRTGSIEDAGLRVYDTER